MSKPTVHSPSDYRHTDARAVLVTGASSGIGKSCALHLAEAGFRVFAGTRRESDATELRNKAKGFVQPLALDVTRDQSIADAVDRLSQALLPNEQLGLVNNAGIAVSGPLEAVDSAALRQQFEVNVVGVVAVTRALLPQLRARQGRIVNMGSTSGRLASAFVGPYCASKFALEAITNTLRLELMDAGIRVSMIEPGVVSTPFWKKMQVAEQELLQRLPDSLKARYRLPLDQRRALLARLRGSGMPAEKVASVVVTCLLAAKPRRRYVVGMGTRLRASVVNHLPDSLRQTLSRLRNASARRR